MGKRFKVVKTLRGRETGETGPIRTGLPPESKVDEKEVVIARRGSPGKN
jgi:hypothetical protein